MCFRCMKISTEVGSKTETKKKDQMEVLEMKSSWVDMTEERVSDLKSININYLREKKKESFRGNEQSLKGLLAGI